MVVPDQSSTDTHFEVIRDEEFGGPEEVEYVAEHGAVPIDEVVLLQTVQHYGLRSIEQTADPDGRQRRQLANQMLGTL